MISVSDLKRWQAVCLNGLHNGADLYENEQSFLASLEPKFEKYAQDTYLSEKQEAWLEKLETKLQAQLGGSYEE